MGRPTPSEFLQVYITVITAAGGNDAVMASYFHVALTGPARTWLMNFSPGSIQSWSALFSTNFASADQQHGVETHLHTVRQQPGESLRAFISRFTKVRGTIPSISDASIITAFRQGVRDEKMLEKLATHQVETVATLFALADKCARATEGRAWHSAPKARAAQTGGPSSAAHCSDDVESHGVDMPQSGTPVAAIAPGGLNSRGKLSLQQGRDSEPCPVHPGSHHSASECCEIQKLAKHVSKRREQASNDHEGDQHTNGR